MLRVKVTRYNGFNESSYMKADDTIWSEREREHARERGVAKLSGI